ncbi:MAG: leucine-rich repeat domain-containing protein [Ruminococcus sp.]|nr:leucine-rich repeat domain-containing protein [Ruminococcus sp.]MCM1480906.1 leucine-rich repeat domain-containing protein [Muribaculaceae bacterium]
MSKSRFKRMVCIIIAFSMALTFVAGLPISIFPNLFNKLIVYANGGTIADGVCGDDLRWNIDDAGVFTITGTGDMYTYEYTSDSSKHPTYSAYCLSVTKIVIEEDVASISPYAFISYYSVSYPKLTEVNIKSKKIKTIPAYCFCNCSKLTAVNLPNQIETLGSSSFSGCPITNIVIPEEVKVISSSVFTNLQMTNLALPYGLETIGSWAFEYSKIEKIVIPETVHTIGTEAFRYSNLKELTLHSNGITIGEYAFANTKIEELYYPKNITLKYDTSTGYGYTFYSSKLIKLYFEEGVTSIDVFTS